MKSRSVNAITATVLGLAGWGAISTGQTVAEVTPPMLAGTWLPDDPHQIDYGKLPRLSGQPVVVSDVRAAQGVNQHNYLVHHEGRFFAMWSDGPGIEDRVGQMVKFSTSADGLAWSSPMALTPPPPNSGPDSPHYGTRTDRGMRWISRGFWVREGELLALAALDEAAGFFGPSLALHAFRWKKGDDSWEDLGVIADDAINNFPPKRLPGGDWMMSRRTHDYKETGVQFLIGGAKSIRDWRSIPVLGTNSELSAEEPLWWSLPDGRLVALFRDNRGSKFLYRSLSEDHGQTWSPPEKTNFPDATSKLHGLRLSDGRYVLVSNGNPRARDPLTLALSANGITFDKLAYLVGGRHVDYPHVIEHEGRLLVAFAGGKQTVEVISLRLGELDAVVMPDSVESDQALPPIAAARAPAQDWIDLGDEGKTLFLTASLTVPDRGRHLSLGLATVTGEERVTIGIDPRGRLTARLYDSETTGPELEAGKELSLLARVISHQERPDALSVQVGPSGVIPPIPETWPLVNESGSSQANLSRLVVRGNDAGPGFQNPRVAPTHAALASARVIAPKRGKDRVVVYGGTPGGIAAAISAARMGSEVILVEPNDHIGGMTSSGLGKSDIENREKIGGLFKEFVASVLRHYVSTYGIEHENTRLCHEGYYGEPSVAEAIFESMLAAEPRIEVLKGWRLVGAETTSDRINSIEIASRRDPAKQKVEGAVFVDATYEGDLFAAAGARYRMGRESREEFGEPHAGVIYFDYQDRKFLPGTTGEADDRLPAYTYRLCLTRDPANSKRLTEPPSGYDRKNYLGYFDDLRAGRLAGPKVLKPGRGYNPEHFDTLVRALSVTDIPNRKTDVNINPRPLGFPFPEENRGYIEGDEATRERIRERHRELTLGLIWFLQNDPEVPETHRKLANELHLPKDEFTDNQHFPWQLYVREGRRLVGEATLTEHDITGRGKAITRQPDRIAVGEFPIDSFPVRKRQPGDTIVLEGYLGMLDHITRPYEIPYRIMIPEKVDGLIVPVAASTTHVAFSSIRMEPTWMALGQAAGVAAHLAIENGVAPRRVPINRLQSILKEQGQVLEHQNEPFDAPLPR